MIELTNVSYCYPNGTLALDRVSVQFPTGTISAVLGESGSGKTTLLMCLGKFQQPTSGRILLDGVDITTIEEASFRRKIGIVFQNLYLFPHLTILENMILAPVQALGMRKDEAESHARKMMTRLGIENLADAFPNQISGGQAQRAAIARGLLLKPGYMLLDEPTSALDANTTDTFAEWLVSLRSETNFVIVTHDTLFAAKVACEGVYLSGGEVLDQGDVGTIIRRVRSRRKSGEHQAWRVSDPRQS